MRIAIVRNETVENVVLADRVEDVSVQDGRSAVACPDWVAPGNARFESGSFVIASPVALDAGDLGLVIKAECQRRIYAVVDRIAQVNLAAAAAGGVLTTQQMTLYRSGLAWIASMRSVCATLIAASDRTFAEDRHWPEPSAEIITLANEF